MQKTVEFKKNREIALRSDTHKRTVVISNATAGAMFGEEILKSDSYAYTT